MDPVFWPLSSRILVQGGKNTKLIRANPTTKRKRRKMAVMMRMMMRMKKIMKEK